MRTLRECILELRENPCMSPQYGERVADEMLAILDDAEILGREDRPDSWCVLIPDPKVDE